VPVAANYATSALGEFNDAQANLALVSAAIAPSDPKAPHIGWGVDNGAFAAADEATHSLVHGLSDLSEVYTQRQAGPLFSALANDVTNVNNVKGVLDTVAQGANVAPYAAAPAFTPKATADLAQASADAASAIAMLTGHYAAADTPPAGK
jgi:hypothetical protein